MAGRSKGKEKAKGPARRHPEWDKIEAAAKIQKRSASSRRTPSARSSKAPSKTPSKTPSAAASPAPPAVNGKSNGNGGPSTPSSDTSLPVKDFYAHMEATSSESSRWDTDSVLGAVLEELTDETGSPGGEITPIHPPLFVLCYAPQGFVFMFFLLPISLVVSCSFLPVAAYTIFPVRVVCVFSFVLLIASPSLATTQTHARFPFSPTDSEIWPWANWGVCGGVTSRSGHRLLYTLPEQPRTTLTSALF